MKHLKFLSLLLIATVSMFAFTACGDDDEKGSTSNGGNSGNSDQPTQVEKMVVGTWETYAVIPEGGKEVSVNSTDPNVYAYWSRFVFDGAGNFNGYAVNYKGGEGVRGNIEHTMLGKYAFDAAKKELQLYDFIEGYHEVKAYLNGDSTISKKKITATFISIDRKSVV